MADKMQVRQLVPCKPNYEGVPVCTVRNIMRCGPDCNGDGTQWEVVGTLVHDKGASDDCGRWSEEDYLYTIKRNDG